ncbi:MAG: DUF4358 domain-containing protein [Ruminococcaceae bacterium]|nr:DUF4358 domain-containing protein [Oscillospiraceae bacterium]
MKRAQLISLTAVILALAAVLLCSCSKNNLPITREQAEKFVSDISTSTNIFSEEMIQLGDNSVSNVFSFLDDSPWKVCYAGISGVTADELIVAEAPSTEKLDEYCTKINRYIENRISQFSGYAPEETPKLESALVIKDGTYLIYIVCADVQAAQQMFNDIKK